MGTPDNYKTLFNNSGGAVAHGALARASGNNGFVLAQADQSGHVAGFVGVNGSGTIGAGGPANIFSSGGSIDVLLDTGLTPVAGGPVYVSSATAGRGTTLAPTIDVLVGIIEDASKYVATGIVTVALSISTATSSSSSVTGIFTDSINTTGVKLSAYDTSGFIVSSSYQAFVGTVGDYFGFRRGSSLPVDGITVIAASGTAGAQWVRLLIQNKAWQSQLTWSVDPSNITGLASNENTGIDDAAPLLTHAECTRRLGKLVVPLATKYLVRHLSSDLAGASATYDVHPTANDIFFGAGVANAIPNLFGSFTILGVPTTVYSGIMSSVSQVALGGVGDVHFTDAMTPAFSNANGRLWARTGASPCGFWPQKDLGAQVTRVSCPGRTTGRVTIANGDAYSILQLPLLNDVNFSGPQLGGFPTVVMQCQIGSAGNFNDTIKGAPSAYMLCDMTAVSGKLTIEGAVALFNCRNPLLFLDTLAATPPPQVAGGIVDLSSLGGGQGLPATGGLFMGQGFPLSFQGQSLTLDHGTSIFEADLMFFDCVDCVTIGVTRQATLARVGIASLGGSGNTGKLIYNAGSNSFVNVLTVGLGATSDGNPYRLNATSSATLPLVDFVTKVNCIIAQ